MYTLYYLPEACSLATQTVLLELGQTVELIDKQQVDAFDGINPVGTVPVLVDGRTSYTEGAAVLLHLLEKHPNNMMPTESAAKKQAIQNIMFANATMHPAYSRLFFVAQHVNHEETKHILFDAAANSINHLWQVVESKLSNQTFLGGDTPSAADILLAVYVRWGAHFPVSITLGPKAQTMVEAIHGLPSFKQALANEQARSAA